MPQQSAGILLYRIRASGPEVLLVHPGGPFYARKDLGVWSVPKGLYEPDEDALAAAQREFREELGMEVPSREFTALQPVRQKGGKLVHVWAARGELDAEAIRSNTFSMEFPPKSGLMKTFPEVDRAAWFAPGLAKEKILPAQAPLIAELEERLSGRDK
jgi:predicted NUDIX family NTP pyrophosphohydrolase